MTAPIPPLRKQTTASWQRSRKRRGLRYLFSRPSVFEIADRSKRAAIERGGEVRNWPRAKPKPESHNLDDIAEYLLSPQGRETAGLVLIVAGCLGLIYVLQHA
jgi:hypothetical protein